MLYILTKIEIYYLYKIILLHKYPSTMTPPSSVLLPPQCQTLAWIELLEKERIGSLCILGAKPISSKACMCVVFDVKMPKL